MKLCTEIVSGAVKGQVVIFSNDQVTYLYVAWDGSGYGGGASSAVSPAELRRAGAEEPGGLVEAPPGVETRRWSGGGATMIRLNFAEASAVSSSGAVAHSYIVTCY